MKWLVLCSIVNVLACSDAKTSGPATGTTTTNNAAATSTGTAASGTAATGTAATGNATGNDAATGSAVGSAGASADAGTAAPTAKRPPPPAPIDDKRPITWADFMRQPLNPRDANGNEIHASADGGCHVYLRATGGPPPPPGWFPPPTQVACPASLLAAEWGRCVGAGTMYANTARDQCVCQPNEGDPPLPPFRVACPPP